VILSAYMPLLSVIVLISTCRVECAATGRLRPRSPEVKLIRDLGETDLPTHFRLEC
jgi:hypothetical protein